jgi:hypothetical protein
MSTSLAIPASTSVIPAAMQGNYQPPTAVSLYRVTTPSGQFIEVLGAAERDFYEGQCRSYMAQNLFTNTSDLMDLDRLIFLELLIYRATSWIGRGQDYDGLPLSDSGEVAQRRSLKETSTLISVIKNDLGLTKSQRDKDAYSSVGTYITALKQRAREFGIHREKQVATAITLNKQLFAILGAYDRSDEVERKKIGFENADEILDWIRTVMIPEFDAVDAHFIEHTQKYWTDS